MGRGIFRGPKQREELENRTPSAAAGCRRSSVKVELGKAAAAMEAQPTNGREKKVKRKEVRERKKKIDNLIQATSSEPTISLISLPSDVSTEMDCNLLKVNMEDPFGEEWPEEEKVKRREMVSLEARYIFVKEGSLDNDSGKAAVFVGFVHFRFTLEDDIPVLYVYEIQLQSRSCPRQRLGQVLNATRSLLVRVV
ncbi:unnamed protein product [Linum trigynum]|uniref:Uncharacterized protein n=1 Tax=Linum trigynum TaxID=586398 RepID=A0AAV2F5X5_9ROSI